MATTLTPDPKYTSTLVMSDNGEDLDADVVKDVLQVLGDRAALAKDAVLGALRGADTIEVAPGGSATSFSITIGDIRALTLVCGDGVVRCLAAASIAAVTQAAVEGGGATLGASTKFWYLYASAATTTVAFEVSDIAPTADRVWKTGSVGTKRYVGCVPAVSGTPIALRAHRGRYWYRITELGANDTRVLNAGSATSYTDVDLSSFVPPHARMAEIDAYLAPNTAVSTAVGGATLRKNGTAAAGVLGMNCGTGAQWPAVERSEWIETDASRLIEYRVSTSSGTDYPALSLYVYGFAE